MSERATATAERAVQMKLDRREMKKKRALRLQKKQEEKEAKRAAGEEVSDDEDEKERKKLAELTEEERVKIGEMKGKSTCLLFNFSQQELRKGETTVKQKKRKQSAWKKNPPETTVFCMLIIPISTRKFACGAEIV